MLLKGFFPKQSGLAEVRQVIVTADNTWPLTEDDDQLFYKLSHAVENQITADQLLSQGSLPEPEWVEVDGWRNAASEYTILGLRPVGRGAWGHNYDTLRTCQRVEVKVTVHYSVADYALGGQ